MILVWLDRVRLIVWISAIAVSRLMSERLLVAGAAARIGCLPKGHAVRGNTTERPVYRAQGSGVTLADGRRSMTPKQADSLLCL